MRFSLLSAALLALVSLFGAAVDASTSFIETDLYGKYNSAGNGDGSGTSASFGASTGFCIDSTTSPETMYIIDSTNGVIHSSPLQSPHTTSFFVGNADADTVTDGTGTSAAFEAPIDCVVTGGSIYVSDVNTLRSITSGGTVTTVVGPSTGTGDDGTGTAASFQAAYGLIVNTFTSPTTIYVLDTSPSCTVRAVSVGTWAVTTVAGGSGTCDNGGVLVDGTGTFATFSAPFFGVLDNTGSYLYVTGGWTASSGGGSIRKVTVATGVNYGVVTTVLQTGAGGQYPVGITWYDSTYTQLYVTAHSTKSSSSNANLYSITPSSSTLGTAVYTFLVNTGLPSLGSPPTASGKIQLDPNAAHTYYYSNKASVYELSITGFSGDPVFYGFSGQSYQIYGEPNIVYSILTLPCLNVAGRFSYIPESVGRQPHQLSTVSGHGVDVDSYFRSGLSSSDSVVMFANSTKQWSHPGNYISEIGLLVNGVHIRIAAGRWENGFDVVSADNATLAVGDLIRLTSGSADSRVAAPQPAPRTEVEDSLHAFVADSTAAIVKQFSAAVASARSAQKPSSDESADWNSFDGVVSAVESFVDVAFHKLSGASDRVSTSFYDESACVVLGFGRGMAQAIDSLSGINGPAEMESADGIIETVNGLAADLSEKCKARGGASSATDRPSDVFVRLSSHTVILDLSYLALVIRNADGFLNLDSVWLRESMSSQADLSQMEGILGQSYHTHHMSKSGRKVDHDKHDKLTHEAAKQQAELYSRSRADALRWMIQQSKQQKQRAAQRKVSEAGAGSSVDEAALLSEVANYYTASRRANDERYHIHDYFVVSQSIFGTDFVENRYTCAAH